MKKQFIRELATLARSNSNIVLMVGDLGYSVIEPFAEEFPDRFFNVGVAEQNMASLAAGMASEGYHVFIYSIANFSTFRCAEQIRNDIDYHKLSVTIVSVGGGLVYGPLGYSHHAVQDYALMRVFPNMTIASPADSMEITSCLRYIVNNPGPSYLRLGAASDINFHENPPVINTGCCVKISQESSRKAILSTGAVMHISMEYKKQEIFSDYDILSMPIWSMSSKYMQNKLFNEYEEIITLEDHLLCGGFGSWLLEARSLLHNCDCVIKPKGLNVNIFEHIGPQDYLNKIGGLIS